jgi:hypothetical protein
MAVSEPDKSDKPEGPAKKAQRPKSDEDSGSASQDSRQRLLSTGLSRSIVIAAFVWAAVALTNGLLTGRFELIPAPNTENSFMYRLDHVTGNVHFCGTQQCVQVPIKGPAQD